ncbi:3'(2'),5'-bisphosphate nucleotidase CysQ [Ketobacter sp. MCCC 1A13808]|uniref:3'(2'),5'-bisphosphate nucleotidase CysQ n=1 Tax=Ketobacter sp. MCCC 1A13808 TaxID=2602738 RepID=UPI000F181EFE|nr:3'(2'),5'-bisphosphate nucleotidase CysQ [Ketobacter sp. MCCC 1A13808]MVF14115.1 3'(2'),5'-bisphosphate nucleotidase CysQ [Ketobacter sp. MCCC 1A13808]RLP55140.1 MAG: 3'(2'),5'-bisphosphate nucleotidase [Ketobacter sp.]
MSDFVSKTLIEQVLKIAESAGDAIKVVYDRDRPVEIETKKDDSPVTEADHAAHHIIVDQLRALTPDIAVFSEESEAIPFSERKQWQRYWLVDPLDGTKEFINRTGEFTVNIALVEDNQPVLGVVTVPLKDQAYVGAKGVGSYKVDKGTWNKITVRAVENKELVVVGSRRHGAEKLTKLMQQLETDGYKTDMTSMGSSLKFCLIAEGKADFYPRLAPTSEWDTAAAQAVLMEAGGRVVTTDFKPLTYNREDSVLNPEFYALGAPEIDWQGLLQAN